MDENVWKLSEAMAWCQSVNALLRFHDDGGSPCVRIAVHTDPSDHEQIEVRVISIDLDDESSLVQAIAEARDEIEPLMRRRLLRVVS